MDVGSGLCTLPDLIFTKVIVLLSTLYTFEQITNIYVCSLKIYNTKKDIWDWDACTSYILYLYVKNLFAFICSCIYIAVNGRLYCNFIYVLIGI